MIPFSVHFRSGLSLYEQVIHAAKKAIISERMRPGDPFPSVRALSREFKINPNAAHNVVNHLVASGLLERRPGIGTVVADLPEPEKQEKTQLLENEIEELVVEAKKLGIGLAEINDAVTARWTRPGASPSPEARPWRGGRQKR